MLIHCIHLTINIQRFILVSCKKFFVHFLCLLLCLPLLARLIVCSFEFLAFYFHHFFVCTQNFTEPQVFNKKKKSYYDFFSLFFFISNSKAVLLCVSFSFFFLNTSYIRFKALVKLRTSSRNEMKLKTSLSFLPPSSRLLSRHK